MPQTAAKYAGTVAEDASAGTALWTNVTNAQGSNDTTVALVSTTAAVDTRRLKATNFGFTTSDIPAGSTINGFLIRLRARGGTTNRMRDKELFVVQGNTTQTGATNLGTSTNFTATLTNRSYGSSSELFGLSWTDTDVTDSGFGLSVQMSRSNTTTCEVAWFEIKVDYTEPSTEYNDSASGTVTLTGTATDDWLVEFVYDDGPAGTIPVTGTASEDWSVGGGGPTFSDTVTGRIRIKS